MRVFSISPGSVVESAALPDRLPEQGHVWVACTRQEFGDQLAPIQAMLQALCSLQLLDLHISDLLNPQLSSHFDYTSQYDLLVFRRLAAAGSAVETARPSACQTAETQRPADPQTPRHQPGRLCGVRARAADGAPGRLRGA